MLGSFNKIDEKTIRKPANNVLKKRKLGSSPIFGQPFVKAIAQIYFLICEIGG